MAIQLDVPLRELQNPAVARALSDLMLALGEHSIALPVTQLAAETEIGEAQPSSRPAKKKRAKRAKRTPPPTAKAEPEVAVAEPEVAVAEPEPEKVKQAAAPAEEEQTDKKKRGKNRKKWVPREPEPNENDRTLAERYQVFYDQLPDLSRAFLRLLEIRGTLTPDEALSELKINSPKALGGLTGSISRWAPKRGVPVPFRVEKPRSGPRIWRWTLDQAIAEEKAAKRS
jgi:hypothetical protein